MPMRTLGRKQESLAALDARTVVNACKESLKSRYGRDRGSLPMRAKPLPLRGCKDNVSFNAVPHASCGSSGNLCTTLASDAPCLAKKCNA